jgi:exosortase/archaeosortase family protein
VAILIRGHWLFRALILGSAIPIALTANIVRIVVTAILHETVGSGIANLVFHDLAGWFMMPLALVLLGLELWVLKHVLVERGGGARPSSARRPPQPTLVRSLGGRKGRSTRLLPLPPS